MILPARSAPPASHNPPELDAAEGSGGADRGRARPAAGRGRPHNQPESDAREGTLPVDGPCGGCVNRSLYELTLVGKSCVYSLLVLPDVMRNIAISHGAARGHRPKSP